MREIKFRGKPIRAIGYLHFSQIWKDNFRDGFAYGSLVIDCGRYYICVSALCSMCSCINNGDTSMIEVIPETVGQYTGLPDKKGTEIYEGDIVKGKDNAEKSIKIFGHVDFTNGSFVVVGDLITHYRWIDYEVEVIGNIHYTLELLEAEE